MGGTCILNVRGELPAKQLKSMSRNMMQVVSEGYAFSFLVYKRAVDLWPNIMPGLSHLRTSAAFKNLLNKRKTEYSGNQEFLGIEAGFNPEVQSQLGISFPPAATQLILMNICFMD